MKAVSTFETTGTINQATQRHTPDWVLSDSAVMIIYLQQDQTHWLRNAGAYQMEHL
jgi:hypothetical protein